MSVRSRSSRSSVKSGSFVDETLFGRPDKTGKRKFRSVKGTTSRLQKSEVEKLFKDPQTAIVSRNQLEQIREYVVPQKVIDRDQKNFQNEKKKMYQRTLARKEKIRQIDARKKKLGTKKLSDLEQEKEMKDKRQIEESTTLMDEEIDEVKHMNSLMLYAQCATIREKQLEEKKRLEELKKKEECQVDKAMEIERLKALQMYQDRERKRREDRKKGAAIIREQIKERERLRLREKELKEHEQKVMLDHIERMKQQDQEEAERKVHVTRKLMVEVANANKEQILLKQRQKEQEIEEDERILQYNIEKQKREEALAEEQRRIKAEKEREIARLRAMQEKAQDKQAELDALRAKRAQEEYERNWRKKMQEEAEKKRNMFADLTQARERQKREKENLIAEQARIEREQFEKIIRHQITEEEKETIRCCEETRRRQANARQLKAQITNALELQNKCKREYYEEGELQKQQDQQAKERIELIRQKKIAQMKAAGIPEKYIVELERKNFQKVAL